MDFTTLNFGPDDTDRRLDKVIRKFLNDASLSEIYKLIRKGLIRINEKKTKENYHIMPGDTLQIAAFLLESRIEEAKSGKSSINSENIKPYIVFENQDLLILNKPYDITVHGDKESLDVLVKQYYGETRGNDSLSFKPGPLHRLDRKTTGLLAFSMSLSGARWFSENIESHIIRKTYLGIVQGNLNEPETWIDFIEKDSSINPENFHTVKVSSKENSGKKAVTTTTPIKKLQINNISCTLCSFEIETGRTHQIRSQCSTHGYPLLGDTAYGGKKNSSNKDFFLHAWKLNFPENNPINLPLEIVCEPDFEGIIL